MRYYTNLKCPKCKYSFTGGYRRVGIPGNLGLPFIKCPNCGTVCKTTNKLWSMMNTEDKAGFVVSRVLQTIFNAFAISLVLFITSILLGIIGEESWPFPALLIIGFLGLMLSTLISYLGFRRITKKLEDAYKNKDKDYYADIV